ncbi:MAG: hypothetical protein ABIK78_06615 [candidate division WOR-3 bacterium]
MKFRLFILVIFIVNSFVFIFGKNIPSPEEIKRIDWVNVTTGGGCLSGPGKTKVEIIREAPNPSEICLLRSMACLLSLANPSSVIIPERKRYSTFFRLNGDDSLIFKGLKANYFSGYYQSTDTLRNIISLVPSALQKLNEFDLTMKKVRLINNISGYLQIGAVIPLISGIVIALTNSESKIGLPLIIGGISIYTIGYGLEIIGEYQNASAFKNLYESIQLFNKERSLR